MPEFKPKSTDPAGQFRLTPAEEKLQKLRARQTRGSRKVLDRVLGDLPSTVATAPTPSKFELLYRDPASLIPNVRHARLRVEKQITALMRSIKAFGFTNPIIIDENLMVIGGHARLAAALALGLKLVPTIMLVGLSEAGKRGLALADNKVAELGGWNPVILAEELYVLSDPGLDFDVSITGFSTAEIDVHILSLSDEKQADPVDQVEAIDRTIPAVSALGDVWVLGAHRCACGNSLDLATFVALLKGETADQVITDPPYNTKIFGHVGGLGRTKHAEFAMASGEMNQQEFTTFLATFAAHTVAHCKDGAIFMCFMDWRHMTELSEAAQRAGLELKNLCIWNKQVGGMGSLYRSQHELIFVYKHGAAKHTNNVELGANGRSRTNVWTYPGANMFRPGRMDDLETHPTVKPIAMIMDAIMDCSRHGEIILDPFGGSGTTLLAAERTGRRARLIELDPYYVDATIQRWEQMTGQSAILERTGETFIERAEAVLSLPTPTPHEER